MGWLGCRVRSGVMETNERREDNGQEPVKYRKEKTTEEKQGGLKECIIPFDSCLYIHSKL